MNTILNYWLQNALISTCCDNSKIAVDYNTCLFSAHRTWRLWAKCGSTPCVFSFLNPYWRTTFYSGHASLMAEGKNSRSWAKRLHLSYLIGTYHVLVITLAKAKQVVKPENHLSGRVNKIYPLIYTYSLLSCVHTYTHTQKHTKTLGCWSLPQIWMWLPKFPKKTSYLGPHTQ